MLKLVVVLSLILNQLGVDDLDDHYEKKDNLHFDDEKILVQFKNCVENG